MNLTIEKAVLIVIVPFHIFVQFLIFSGGEGVLFGVRYVDNPIRIFTGVQIIISIISIALVSKNTKLVSVFFGLSVACAYIIEFGHRLGFWDCAYCEF